ncbi:hypothetical protein VV02_07840 [Luteipulveratus mongoliensis]|uniref:HTH arsR-type domain-containing protein n=2 Tax=Luteipulveratus mongoliensis TaxID=571913 RepID=A0A0K1JGF9_9MICO|nr:hypothetical protein VV02_07840 [Luteipulveratus mongoliensis]
MHAASDLARIRLLHALILHGPQTGTDLGRRVVEARASIGYHLGMLHAVGHVAIEDGDGKSRNTVWRADMQDMTIPEDLGQDDDLVEAALRMERAFLRCRSEAQLDFAHERRSDPAWKNAASRDSLLWLTPEQADDIEQGYADMISEIRDTPRKPGAVPALVTFAITPYQRT